MASHTHFYASFGFSILHITIHLGIIVAWAQSFGDGLYAIKIDHPILAPKHPRRCDPIDTIVKRLTKITISFIDVVLGLGFG